MSKNDKEFQNFIVNLLKYRCLLKESIVSKYFDNPEGLKYMRQAFIHKSISSKTGNYELMEFEGDPVLNLCTVEFIRAKFPEIINVGINTRIKHTLISGKTLGRLAIENGFEKFLIVDQELKKKFDYYPDKFDSDDYVAAYEDTVEAVVGAINNMLNKHETKGVGYRACYNLISSFLEEVNIPTSYEEVFDPISRMKELFDQEGWNEAKLFPTWCSSHQCLVTYNTKTQMNEIIQQMTKLVKFNPKGDVIDLTANFVSFGYACLPNDLKNLPVSKTVRVGEKVKVNTYEPVKKILSGASANKDQKSRHLAADRLIEKLRTMGIYKKVVPDPYVLGK